MSSQLNGTAIACGSRHNAQEEYNKPLHVGALFVIMAVSTLAAIFPLIATRVERLRVPQKALFIVKHFGTGVLVGTAFCHLLPTAFTSLLDPCLGDSSVFGRYPALSGAIAMGGVFAVTAVELAFAEVHGGKGRHFHHRSDLVDGPVRHPDGTLTPAKTKDADATPSVASNEDDHIKAKEVEAKAFMQCMLLEMGILFHSVFIGMALSVSRGQAFIVLFIAIVFHQTFEGLGLGTRIALLKFSDGSRVCGVQIPRTAKPILMAFAYGLTTPIGQAIGLALLFSPSTSYDPASRSALILVGTMNALSAGLLTWASLVELLAADFFGEERTTGIMGQGLAWRIAAYVCVILGAVAMATVGAWA